MTIEEFAEAAKAKIAELQQVIATSSATLESLNGQVTAVQQAINDANNLLSQHQNALGQIESIAPEVRAVLNALFPPPTPAAEPAPSLPLDGQVS